MTADAAQPVLVVTGLRREARLAAGRDVTVVCSGGSPARLQAALATLPPDFAAVVSFGIACGLDPQLAPGDVVLASSVVAAGRQWPVHAHIVRNWIDALSASYQDTVLGDLAGSERLLLTPADKLALQSVTGAVAADMESALAAAFASSRGLPFAAIRTICDPVSRTLPPLVSVALRPDGSLDFLPILRSLAQEPLQLVRLPRIARDASAAFSSLRRCRAILGRGFGLFGAGKPFRDIP